MLRHVHPWLIRHGFPFAALFGAPDIYGSSGYVQVKNLTYDADPPKGREPVTAMVKELANTPWPVCPVHLRGPRF